MKKKNFLISAFVLSVMLLVGGVTYAFYVWNSSNDTDVSFDVDGLSIKYNGSAGISIGEQRPFVPVATKEEGITKDVIVQLDSKQVITPTPTFNLYMDLTSFPSVLADASFKWEVYLNDGLEALASGNFEGRVQGDSITLVENRTITLNKDTYTLYLWINGNEENDTEMQGQHFYFTLHANGNNATGVNSFSTTFASFVMSDAELYPDQVMEVTHLATSQVDHETTDYRYYGATPNNYVYFNCKDTDDNEVAYGEDGYNYSLDNCELWRVIGVFETESPLYSGDEIVGYTPEYRVKIIRNESLGNYSFDSSISTVNGGYGINAWEQADLMATLNGIYMTKGSGTCYNGNNNASTTCDFSTTGLSTAAKNLLEPAKYYLGGTEYNQLSSVNYAGERGTTYKSCSDGDYCNDTYTRQGTWTGMVGLMYGSDYGYAAGSTCANNTTLGSYSSSCKSSDWLYDSNIDQRTLSPFLDSSNAAHTFFVSSNGDLSNNLSSDAYGIRPVVYLNADVRVNDGYGTSASPWVVVK